VKRELRERVRRVLADIDPVTLGTKSAAATELLVDTSEFRRAQIVMVFLSLPGEIDTTSLVLRSWQEHKRVLAPRVSWEQRRMMPTEIRSLTTDLVETAMGLREPVSGAPIPIGIIDLVIVPGLAFDAKGNRLGRGRGFYDRFLAHPEFQGTTCGLACEEQYLAEVPVDSLDRPVSMLVTDARVRRFAGGRRAAKTRTSR
jgi:5-formyltetrahydrofolate cyclo-ligase